MRLESFDLALLSLPGVVVVPPGIFQFSLNQKKDKRLVDYCLKEAVPLGLGAGNTLKKVSGRTSNSLPPRVFPFGRIRRRQESKTGIYHVEVELEGVAESFIIHQHLPFFLASAKALWMRGLEGASEREKDKHGELSKEETKQLQLATTLLAKASDLGAPKSDSSLSELLKRGRLLFKKSRPSELVSACFLPDLVACISRWPYFSLADKEKLLLLHSPERRAQYLLHLVEGIIDSREQKEATKSRKGKKSIKKKGPTIGKILFFPETGGGH